MHTDRRIDLGSIVKQNRAMQPVLIGAQMLIQIGESAPAQLDRFLRAALEIANHRQSISIENVSEVTLPFRHVALRDRSQAEFQIFLSLLQIPRLLKTRVENRHEVEELISPTRILFCQWQTCVFGKPETCVDILQANVRHKEFLKDQPSQIIIAGSLPGCQIE